MILDTTATANATRAHPPGQPIDPAKDARINAAFYA